MNQRDRYTWKKYFGKLGDKECVSAVIAVTHNLSNFYKHVLSMDIYLLISEN